MFHLLTLLAFAEFAAPTGADGPRPNVVRLMPDDMGWGDPRCFNADSPIRTPNIDAMAAAGLKFNRFYAAAPVCSPTRGACLTARHPFRYGVTSANVGHMKPEERTLAELLQKHGYTTGHFGKWHLGTLTTEVRDGRRGGRKNEHFSPPWKNGFDASFSAEVQMPTWDPMKNQNFPSKYWTGPEEFAKTNLDGDDSRVIMDRAVPFIEQAVKAKKPFFAVVWFHAPHAPVVAGPEYRKLYAKFGEDEQHYYGCITALDEQVGRLRKTLKDLGVANDTMVWFCSDNGPEGAKQQGRNRGSAGPFRGRKRSLYEGGIRVPGILEWPAQVKAGSTTDFAAVTSDYLPTILDALQLPVPDKRPLDGVSLIPLLEKRQTERAKPIGFQSGNQLAWSAAKYKLYSSNGGKTWELYDLSADPGETRDIAAMNADRVRMMAAELEEWRRSCAASDGGADYR